jgi:hypothetical protein
MAFTNYQDLISAVESWVDREEDQDTIDRIPDFIVFAEKKVFRRLRSRLNEAKADFPEDTAAGILLPQDFKEVKYLLWDGFLLERKSDQWFFEHEPTSGNTPPGTPKYFARTEQNLIEFWQPPDNDAPVVLYYYNQQGAISDQFIPPLYTEAPELYLFGALIEALPFLKKPEHEQLWKDKFAEVMNDLQTEADEAEYAGGTVAVSSVYTDGALRTESERGVF